MKLKLLLCFYLCFHLAVGDAQSYTISATDNTTNCFNGKVFTRISTDATGRNVFQMTTPNGLAYQIKYVSARSRWEFIQVSDLSIWFYLSSSATPNPPLSGWITFDNVCGDITSAVLPVELTQFGAKVAGQEAILSWATASEKNNQGFDIERSLDGTDFQKIGFVKGNGTTNLPQQYTYTDASVQSITYYRLKQVDTDGKFEYSKVVSVESDVRSTVRVKPTFVNDVLTVEGAASYEIRDAAGRVVLQSIENQLNVQLLPQGFYVVRGRDGAGNPFVQKIIKN
jgi:hypothetical protein